MDIKQLLYFVTVVDEGNISSAAKKLHISQPPLSTQIRLLEEELGSILFERGARKIQLTEAGRMLYRRALSLLDMSELIKKELKDYSSGMKGVLRLGIVSSVEEIALDRWIKPFHEIYPGIRFEVSESNTYETLDLLRDNILELAFVRTPFISDDMDKLPLKRERMYAVGNKAFFNKCGGNVAMKDIEGKPLIIYKRWERIIMSRFDSLDLKPKIVCTNEDARTTAIWADKGMGVGIMPESALSLLRDEDILSFEIDDDGLVSEIYLIAHKNTYRSAIASAFWDYMNSKENN